MSMIYVNVDGIRDVNYDLLYIEAKAKAVKTRMQGLKRGLPAGIKGRYQIGPRLEYVCKETGRLESELRELYEVTSACAEQYAEAEYHNQKNAKAFY